MPHGEYVGCKGISRSNFREIVVCFNLDQANKNTGKIHMLYSQMLTIVHTVQATDKPFSRKYSRISSTRAFRSCFNISQLRPTPYVHIRIKKKLSKLSVLYVHTAIPRYEMYIYGETYMYRIYNRVQRAVLQFRFK